MTGGIMFHLSQVRLSIWFLLYVCLFAVISNFWGIDAGSICTLIFIVGHTILANRKHIDLPRRINADTAHPTMNMQTGDRIPCMGRTSTVILLSVTIIGLLILLSLK